MANEIYSSSWWGEGVCTNTIDWGSSYKALANCTPTPPSFNNTYSLAFDGVDDYVQAPLDGTSTGGILAASDSDVELTISFWFKVNNTSSGEGIWQWGNLLTSPSPFILFRTSSGPDRVRFYMDGSYQALQDINLNQWYHVVLTRTASDNTWRGYLDGNATAWFTKDDGGFITARSFATDIYFGNGYNGYAPCNIDEFAVFNKVLTPTEISEIYNSGVPNDLTSLNPVAWYRNGDNGTWKSPQWLIPENSNKTKFSNYSFEYDGIDDQITISSSFITTGEFTLSLWIKPTILNSNQNILGNGTSSNNWINPSSATNIRVKPAGTLLNFSETGGNNLTVGSWNHILIYRNSSNDIGIFVNGATFSSTQNNSNTLTLSTIGRGTNKYFSGNIDEAAFFNSDKSSDVATIYNSGVPSDLSSLSPVGYWRSEQSNFTDNWLVDNSALSNYSTRSFNFDGVDDSLIGPEANLASAYTKASWSYWFNASSLPASTTSWVYSRRGSNDNYGELWGINNLGKLIGNIGQSNALDGDYIGNTTISTNTWYNVVITYDGSASTNDDKVKVYLNGNLETLSWTGTVQTELLQNPGAGRKHAIGFGGASYFEGKIDEVAVWYDTTLTSANAITIYNSGEPAELSSLIPNFINIRMGENATFSTNWNVPDSVNSPTNDFTSSNMTISDLEGNAPNYTGGGLSNNMTIEDRVGDAPNSTSNALSYNMDEVDRETDVPT
jgi:hypothetical protein